MFSGELAGAAACVALVAYLPCEQRIVVKKEKPMRYGGLGGLIVLIADVWAIVNILQSGASTADKVLWTVIVVVLPILGFILWFFLGPRTGRA
jgi:drug/metabolite transporter (DMT)-like permease